MIIISFFVKIRGSLIGGFPFPQVALPSPHCVTHAHVLLCTSLSLRLPAAAMKNHWGWMTSRLPSLHLRPCLPRRRWHHQTSWPAACCAQQWHGCPVCVAEDTALTPCATDCNPSSRAARCFFLLLQQLPVNVLIKWTASGLHKGVCWCGPG